MFALIPIGFLIVFMYFYYQQKYTYWIKKGVKGPKPYPILGTYLAEHELPADQTEFKFYQEYGPSYGTYYNSKPVFNTASPDHIKTILNDLHTFPNISTVQFNDDYLAKSIFFKSDAAWKAGRAAQTHYFTSKNLRSLMFHLEKTTANFIENVNSLRRQTGSDDVDVKMMAKYYSIDGISKVLFAIDVDSYKERDTVYVKSVSTLGELSAFNLALCTLLPKPVCEFFRLQPFKLKPVHNLGKYFEKMINDRRKAGVKYNDLTEVLQNAVDNNKVKMTDNEVIGNCMLAFFAGAEAVSNAAANMLYYLSQYPDIQQKLYEEVMKKFSDEITYEELMQNEYLDAFTNEVLRLGANFLLLTRSAAVDTKLGDVLIEKGTEIRLLIHAGHHTEVWNDTWSFNPDRFLKGSPANQNNFFVPFGYGHKICLGMRLALLEVKYLTVNILKRYELRKPTSSGYAFGSMRGFKNVISLNVAFKERINCEP